MSETDDLKTLIRECRTSVTADLSDVHRRINEFETEVRERIGAVDERLEGFDLRLRTAEMAILNEIRSLADRFDRRLERVELELYNR
jgi:hypothetical protein